jgi:hypothetical protein
MIPKYVANEDLKVELLPRLDDPQAIFRFAMLFNGYEHFGSLTECANQAESRRRETLTDLRNELFFSCRSARHQDADFFVEDYRELYPLLRAAIEAAQHLHKE